MVQAIEQSKTDVSAHLEKFGKFERESKNPAWLFPLRKAGMARFAELGFPSTQDEDWRFTNVAPLAKMPFRPVFEAGTDALSEENVAKLIFASLQATRLVFLNGHFVPQLSSPLKTREGLVLTNLASAVTDHADLVQQHLTRYAQSDTNPFPALNTAFFQDGAFIHVPKGVAVKDPVHLVFLSSADDSGSASNPRNLILAGKGSQLTVLESYAGLADSPYFTNAVTELLAGDSAVIEHCKFQDESLSAFHIATFHARIGKAANVIAHSIATGARLSRNNSRTILAGEGLECVLNGLYLTRGEQLADHHMVVEHASPHCASHEYYNGILDGRSRGVFHGRILVRQAAQKTDAKQTNKNLLLSEDATIDTKPQLEIYADDVKCTHGATVGQLNEESVFYLRSRGIGSETARRMLIHAFAGEIIERIRHGAAREELDKVIWDRLEANPHVSEIGG
jgi:Fe-S cluster assembly protein SufD